ncbi:MAG: hypothetical protein NVSMB45_14370 [Ginsengibacter sp.]
MNYEHNARTREIVYTLSEVAKKLNIEGVGRNILYSYLKKLNIINFYNTPNQEYLDLEYFKISYGSMNPNWNGQFPKTVVTPKGLIWLLEVKLTDILKVHREYLAEYEANKKLQCVKN